MFTTRDCFSERPRLEGQAVNTIVHVSMPTAESRPRVPAALLAERDVAGDAAVDAGIAKKGTHGGQR